MKGFVTNIEKETIENENYRKVLYTAKNSQLVLMTIQPGDETGEEVHTLDQFIRIEVGEARVTINDTEYDIEADWAVVIPAGSTHNIINTGDVPLKLYSIYSPAEHKDGTIHSTKADEVEEHFDGVTSE
jgi:mannose-6-phosphate isomerase-like protein (cupin superfamily)